MGFDSDRYQASVTLALDKRFPFPKDTTASILTSGLLGGQYIGLTPGGSDQMFKDGDKIEFVQDAVVLENLISKYLFSSAGKSEAAPAPAPAPPAPKE